MRNLIYILLLLSILVFPCRHAISQDSGRPPDAFLMYQLAATGGNAVGSETSPEAEAAAELNAKLEELKLIDDLLRQALHEHAMKNPIGLGWFGNVAAGATCIFTFGGQYYEVKCDEIHNYVIDRFYELLRARGIKLKYYQLALAQKDNGPNHLYIIVLPASYLIPNPPLDLKDLYEYYYRFVIAHFDGWRDGESAQLEMGANTDYPLTFPGDEIYLRGSGQYIPSTASK